MEGEKISKPKQQTGPDCSLFCSIFDYKLILQEQMVKKEYCLVILRVENLSKIVVKYLICTIIARHCTEPQSSNCNKHHRLHIVFTRFGSVLYFWHFQIKNCHRLAYIFSQTRSYEKVLIESIASNGN